MSRLFGGRRCTEEGIPPRLFSSFSDSYEAVFLQVFAGLASKLKGTIRRGSMHRKPGLKMFEANGELVASLKSEYRGTFVEDNKSAVLSKQLQSVQPSGSVSTVLGSWTGHLACFCSAP